MLPSLPVYIYIVFVLTVILAILFLWKASYSRTAVKAVIIWLVIQGAISYSGFYLNSSGAPPRIALAVLPPFGLIIYMLVTKKAGKFIRKLNLRTLHLLHIIRMPVELCLYWLSLGNAAPKLITFTGNNLDIVTGFTAFILYFTCFKGREVRSVNLLFGWNIIGLVMLGSLIVNSFLSAPTKYQRLEFDQPNIAMLYFPFVWWPCFIIMLLLFSHLVMIKRLVSR